MTTLPTLLRTTLRTRLSAAPCTCTRSFSSAPPLNYQDDRRNSSHPSEGASRYSRAGDARTPSSSSSASRYGSSGPSYNQQNARPPPSVSRDGQPKTRDPSKPRGPPRKGRGPRLASQDDPRLPTKSRLPPETPTPTVADLDPEVLHDYRLALMTRMARVPSPEDLEANLLAWIRTERKKETAEVQRAFHKVKLAEQTSEKLDIAWEWQRKADEATGRPRTEEEQRKDRAVRARVLERARQLALEKERMNTEWQDGSDQLSTSSTSEEPHNGHMGKSRSSATTGQKQESSRPRYEEDEPLNPPDWLKHRRAMKDKFPAGWAPPKRISREAIELLRILQRSDPTVYTTTNLAERFKISPEAVRRILKSQFELSPEEKAQREAKRLKRLELKREEEGAEAPTWAGDTRGERGEMRRLREVQLDGSEKGPVE